MQTTIKGGNITMILTKTERHKLQAAADICDGIALIRLKPAATTATELRSLASHDNISRNGSDDGLAAADAAETVSEQTPGKTS